MNVNLYNRVKAALNTERPKVQGYKSLSLSDIETVLMGVDAGIPLNSQLQGHAVCTKT